MMERPFTGAASFCCTPGSCALLCTNKLTLHGMYADCSDCKIDQKPQFVVRIRTVKSLEAFCFPPAACARWSSNGATLRRNQDRWRAGFKVKEPLRSTDLIIFFETQQMEPGKSDVGVRYYLIHIIGFNMSTKHFKIFFLYRYILNIISAYP